MSRLIQQIREYAASQPDKTALVSQTEQLTYAELQTRIEVYASYLEAQGCQRLAIWQDNSINWVIWQLAAMHKHAVVIPIALFFSERQVHNLLHTTQPDLIICDREQALLHAGYQLEQDAQAWGVYYSRRATTTSSGECFKDTALVTFTSGSTGAPKGVKISYEQIDRVCFGLRDAIQPLAISQHHCLLPLAVMLENIAGVFLPLCAGESLVLASADEIGLSGSSGLDPLQFIRYLSHAAPQSLILTPELLKLLMFAKQQGTALNSLTFVAVGGGKVSPQLLHQAHAMGLPVFEGYGLSECGSVVSLNLPSANRIGSVGKPLAHAEVKISAQGEVLIQGPIMQGYLDGDCAVHDYYPTGDLGHLDADGFLFITGRKKNIQINSFGRNINPEWIESELSALPGVTRGLILADNLPAVVAFVQRQTQFNDSQLEQQLAVLNSHLPDYARIQHLIEITPEAIEGAHLLTGNGRLKRAACYRYFTDQISQFFSTSDPLFEQVSHVF